MSAGTSTVVVFPFTFRVKAGIALTLRKIEEKVLELDPVY
jgi:hypothetical protein